MKFTLKREKINWNDQPVAQTIAMVKRTRKEYERRGFRYLRTNYYGAQAEMLYTK